jgi:hypothetical protein
MRGSSTVYAAITVGVISAFFLELDYFNIEFFR